MEIKDLEILEHDCSKQEINMNSKFLCLSMCGSRGHVINWRWNNDIMKLRDYAIYIFIPVAILDANKAMKRKIRPNKIAGFTLDECDNELNEFELKYLELFKSVMSLTCYDDLFDELGLLSDYLESIGYKIEACIVDDIFIASCLARDIEGDSSNKSFYKRLKKVIEKSEK